MRVSVVIATYNRARFLRNTLRALPYQSFTDFEVIVVNGPSSDETTAVLDEFAGSIKVVQIDKVNLGYARNRGIEAAAGDIVAFIDDDALAHRNWLLELSAAFDDARVGAAGGLVYDASGVTLQYRYSACDRLGRTKFDIERPFDKFNTNGADPFLYVQGTNMAFRKNVLHLIGGFADDCEYMHDETDVCMRILDAGFLVQPLDGAIVYHLVAPSHIRDGSKVIKHVFTSVKNHLLFLHRAARSRYSDKVIAEEAARYVASVGESATRMHLEGRLTETEYQKILADMSSAVETAGKAVAEQRPRYQFGEASQFLQFRVKRCAKPLTVCYISKEYPPAPMGGIGAFTRDIAAELARQGHDVHVATYQGTEHLIEFDDGVWIHRIAEGAPLPSLEADPARWTITLATEVHLAVARIHEQSRLDVVIAPAWGAEGLIASLDKRWPTIVWLQTSARSVSEIDPSAIDNEPTITALEQRSVSKADAVHAISSSILQTARKQNGHVPRPFVIHLGLRDVARPTTASALVEDVLRRTEGKQRVLFVGRLEPRKGIDLLLEAIPSILERAPDVVFLVVGRPVALRRLNGRSYRDVFYERHGDSYKDRVFFLGEVSDFDRDTLYDACDLFCAPSRFESFGLVVIEAMRRGTPVVVADIPSFRELVANQPFAWFFPSESISGLANAIDRIFGERAKLREAQDSARAAFKQNFDISVTASRLVDEFRQVVGKFEPLSGKEPLPRFRARLNQLLTSMPDHVHRDVGGVASAIEWRLYPEVLTSRASALFQADDSAFVRGMHDLLHAPLTFRQWFFARYRLRKYGGRVMYLRRLINRTGRGQALLAPKVLETLRRFDSESARKPQVRSLGSMSRKSRVSKVGSDIRALVKLPARIGPQLDQLAQRSVRQSEDITQAVGAIKHAIAEVANRVATERDISDIGQAITQLTDHVTTEREAISGLRQAIDRLAERVEFVRQELFFEMGARGLLSTPFAQTAAPKITNPSKIAELKRSGSLKLNLGCGHIPLSDFLNCDVRDLPGVDVVAAADGLPFEAGEIEEIFSAHFLEHFPEEALRRRLIPYWRSLLRPGGAFRAVVPDAEAMIQSWAEQRMTFDDLRIVTFGGQEYAGDYHYTMFSRQAIARLLADAGFESVELTACGRRNGLCYEMEVRATKPVQVSSQARHQISAEARH
jgi:glycogen(starch) synthase